MPQLEAPEACITCVDAFVARHGARASAIDFTKK